MGKAAIERDGNQNGNPSRDAFLSLIRVSGLLDAIMQDYFSRFGISRSQWAVLRNLYRAESESLPGLRPADLVSRLLVRPPSVTGLIDRLERLGYVRRNEHSEDLRGKEVRLTDAGRSVVERILPGHPAQIASVMRGLDARELRQLQRLLQRLGTHLVLKVDGRGNAKAGIRPVGTPL